MPHGNSPATDLRQQLTQVFPVSSRVARDDDLPGWQRLIRAYTVMGRKPEAVAALAKARGHFTAEPQSLAALTELARNLGLES